MKQRFGELVLDLEAGRLLGPGGEVRLRPQAFKLLVVLVEVAPRLLSHEELLDRVWGVEHLSPASVKQAVSEVRQALGDDPARPSIIETVPRRGYRFIAPLIQVEEKVSEEAPSLLVSEVTLPVPRPAFPRRLALVLGTLLLAGAVSAAALLVRAAPDDTVPRAAAAMAGPAVSPAPFGSTPRPRPGLGWRRRPAFFWNRPPRPAPWAGRAPRPGPRLRPGGPWSDSTVSPRSSGSASKRRFPS